MATIIYNCILTAIGKAKVIRTNHLLAIVVLVQILHYTT